jgi:hypothetical protein
MAAALSALQGIAQVNSVATQTALSLWASVASFVVLIVLCLFFVLFARYVGRGPYVALMLSLYAGYAVYVAFPFQSLLPSAPALTAVLAHAGLYLALVFVFYMILRRVVVSDFIYIGLLGLLVMSFAASAFLIAAAYHVFAVTNVYHFNSAIAQLFEPNQYFFWWFIAPAVSLFFFAR